MPSQKRRGPCLAIYDFVSSLIEGVREWFIDVVVHTIWSFHRGLKAISAPVSSNAVEEQLKSRKIHQSEIRTLQPTPISFFDPFQCVCGVPAYLFNQDEEARRRRGQSNTESCITDCVFSEDGTRFTICFSSGDVVVWDTNHGKRIARNDALEGLQICSIAFFSTSRTTLLVSTRDGLCMIWNTITDEHEVTDFSEDWRDVQHLDARLISHQTSEFLSNGTRLVVSSLLGHEDHFIMKLLVVDTSSLPEKGRIIRLSEKVESNIVLTKMEMSPDQRGLIVGFSDDRVEKGFCVLWPDFEKDPHFQKRLSKGTLGSWSPNGERIVTWTVPEEPCPEANDGGCAFLWNVKELRERTTESTTLTKYTELRNPFGKNVLWCRFVHDMDGGDRLVMCVIRTTARFLFWDVDREIMTYNVATDIPANDIILGNRTSWLKSWVERKSVKGLSPLGASKDLRQLGAVSGFENRVVIWDAVLGVQLLSITPPNKFAEAFEGGVDIIFSPSQGKFAMIGDSDALVFAPPIRGEELDTGVSQMIELENPVKNHSTESRSKVLFSGNGNTLGVLHLGSSEMNIWNLINGKMLQIKTDPEAEGSFQDFCISLDGNHVVTCTSKGLICIWHCMGEQASFFGFVKTKSSSMALGIRPDLSEIVLCSKEGDLVWYNLSSTMETSSRDDLPNTRTRSNSFKDGEDRVPWYHRVSRKGASFYHPLRESRNYTRAVTFATVESSSRSQRTRYLETERKLSKDVVQSCRISAQCDRGVRLLEFNRLEVWDLTSRELIKVIEGVNLGSIRSPQISQLLPLSGEASILDQIQDGTQIFTNTTIASLEEAAMVLPEEDGFVLGSSFADSLLTVQDTNTSYTVLFQEQKNEESCSVFVINIKDPQHNRELKGYKLEPQKGLAMSPDGRHVACLSGRFASRVVVWTCYASEGLIPDYHSLYLKYLLKKKEAVLKQVPRLLSTYGVNFMSSLRSSGTSLLLQAIINMNHSLIKVLLKFALKKNIKVSFWIRIGQLEEENKGEDYENAVSISINQRSPESVKTVMKYLLRRVTHEAEVAEVLRSSLVLISCRYPQIFLHVIHNPELFSPLGEVEIPEDGFIMGKFLTSSHRSLHLTKDEIEGHWIEHWKKGELVEDPDPVTLTAVARVFPFEDAFQVGSTGLLRHLLIHGTHHLTFASFTLKAIVSHKWKTYARSIFIREFANHCLLLIVFTVYSFLLCHQGTYTVDDESGDEENEKGTIAMLVICIALALPSLFRELNQCRLYTTHNGLRGFLFWFGSAWNWMEVLSYVNLAILIPLGQFYFLKDGSRAIVISALAAVESLLLWSRMLFYARPFKSTGPLVIVISAIVSDIVPFLVLALCVMFGFAVAFYILYRHVSPDETSPDDDQFQSMYEAFGTFKRTFFTVFSYVFGDFDLDDIYEAPESNTAMIVFVLYMVIIAIILLNMLIAIMGESFNRILSDEDTRFVKARAMAIDDIDSMLSSRKKRQLKDRLTGYLHVAIPKFIHDKVVTGKRRATQFNKKEIWSELSAFCKENAVGKQRSFAVSNDRVGVADWGGQPVLGPALPTDFEFGQMQANALPEDDGESSVYASSLSSHCFSDDVMD